MKGKIRFWSAGAERTFGWSPQEAVGQISHNLLATQFPALSDDIHRTLLRDGHWIGELRHTTRDGRHIFVATHWVLQRDAAGNPDLVTEINVDVSERRRLEQAQRRLAAIVESSSDAIIAKSRDGVITAWNGAAEALFGYTAAEIVGRPILTLFPVDRLSEEDQVMHRILLGERVAHFETSRRHKDGREIPVSVTISPIFDELGNVVGASKIVRDLSEQRARELTLQLLEAELAHAQRLNELGQLVSALVHEMTQPLAAIRNYLGATLRLLGDEGEPRVRLAIQRAREQGDRAHQIIDNFRDFARKTAPQRRPEDLSATIQRALDLAMLHQPAQRPTVQVTCDPMVTQVLIDRVQIEQVLFNLVRNAMEAMAASPQRRLTIRATLREAEIIEVTVSDSGPGVTSEIRDRLFRPFTTSKIDGMGMGLSICRSIIRAHGGEIHAEDGPGGGALFRFTLMRGRGAG